MHSLQNYGRDEIYDGNAYAFSSTFLDGTLRLFAHHITPPVLPGGQSEHFMAVVARYRMARGRVEYEDAIIAWQDLMAHTVHD